MKNLIILTFYIESTSNNCLLKDSYFLKSFYLFLLDIYIIFPLTLKE